MALTKIKTSGIADNAITNAKMADDAIDSADFVDGSIDNAHLADDAVNSDEIAAGAIDLAHMSVNSIDSDQYVDGSIDLIHMSANSIDSDQYVDGSIDNVHLAGSIAVSKTLLAGGTGLTLSTNTLNVDAAQTQITSLGTLTTLTVDDITLNGSTISDAGDFTLDVGGYTELNNDNGGIVIFSDASVQFGVIEHASSDFVLRAGVQDKDMLFKGNDGGSTITALTFDMSDAGKATFNNHVVVSDRVVGSGDLVLVTTDSNEKIHMDSDGYIKFETAGTEKMRIDSSGNVGIGTTAPSGILHCVVDDTYGEAYFEIADASAGSDFGLKLQKARGTIGSKAIVQDDDRVGFIGFQGYDGSAYRYTAVIMSEVDGTPGSGDMPGRLTFKTVPDGSTTTAERMRIDSAGNVGIGQTSPEAPLHVGDDSGGTGYDTIAFFQGSSTQENNVFIGAERASNNSTLIGFKYVGDHSTSNYGYIMNWGDAPGDGIVIADGGKIGIGTTSPDSKLDISGAGAQRLTIQSTDNDSVDIYLQRGSTTDGHGDFSLNNDAGLFHIQGHASDATVTSLTITGGGSITMPLQPAFLAQPSTGQANIAIDEYVPIVWGSEREDKGGNFASNTFTAPVTGMYQISGVLNMDQVDEGANYYQIRVCAHNRDFFPIWDTGTFDQGAQYYCFPFSMLIDMDASDTVSIDLLQSGGSAQADIRTDSFFSGFLAC